MNQVAKLEGEKVTEGQAISKFDAFKNNLATKKSSIEKVLPAHISFEKFQSVVLTACMQNADLLTADKASMMLACVKSATDGLLPDGRDAALVIFNSKVNNNWIKKVQYMPMYAGILKKCRQSEEISSINAEVVYQKDKFDYALGDDNTITHKPYMGEEDRGEIIAAYCIAKLKDGTIMREVMTRQDIEKVRKTSKSGSANENDVKYKKAENVGDPKGIWKDWYEEMAKKTVFRRCAKWLPQSIDKEGNEIRLFDNDDSMEIIDQYEEEAGVDKDVIEHEDQPDLKKAVEENSDKKEKTSQEDEKPSENKESEVEDNSDAPSEQEKKDRTSLQVDSEIRQIVNEATDHAELLDRLSAEHGEDLERMKNEYAGQYKRLDDFIQSKVKELQK